MPDLPDPTAPPALRVLHDDGHLVAIDKPPGLLVHASALDAHEAFNALDLLQAQLGRPLWPLHRLDKGTSGVLLFATSAQAAAHWGAAFRDGLVRKRYVALVRGWPPAQGRIGVRLLLRDDGSAEIEVADTGPGIAREHIPRLTERFYRVDGSRSRETGGTGLGLAIVKHVAQRHGGELLIESEPGRGSRFRLLLPAARVRGVPTEMATATA